MSKTIAQQDVEFYEGTSKNQTLKGEIKLYKNKLVIIDANKMKISIRFLPSTSIFVNHQLTGFHIHQSEDVSYTVFTTENARQWVKLIDFYVLRYLTRKRHVHPLTMIECGQGTCKACSAVVHSRVEQRSFSCEFCPDSDVLCYECYTRVDSLLNSAVKSDSHKHVLYSFDEVPVKRLEQAYFTCSKCNESYNDDVLKRAASYHGLNDAFKRPVSYHCLECLDYVECAQCFNAPSMHGVHSALDLKHFSEYLLVDAPRQEFSVKPSVMIPAQVSLITEGYWDLSQISLKPADNAYFEVEFLSFNADAVVGIGIGNEIFNSHALLGNQQNSFAYYNNGEIRKNVSVEHNASVYHQGDIVGCGILLDDYSHRQVYFTLNGELIDKRLVVHDGMNCYPGVCFTKESGVHFKTNFNGPFQFDQKLVPNYREDRANYFDALPPEVMQLFFHFVARTPLVVFSQAQLVCKNWRDLSSDNNLWRDAFLYRWHRQNPSVKIRDWKKFYRKRKQALYVAEYKPGHPIENCEFDFKCPLIWQNLKRATSPGVGYCDACNKEVFAVQDKATLQAFAQMGRCVVFNPTPLYAPITLNLRPYGGRPLSDDEEDWDDDEWD